MTPGPRPTRIHNLMSGLSSRSGPQRSPRGPRSDFASSRQLSCPTPFHHEEIDHEMLENALQGGSSLLWLAGLPKLIFGRRPALGSSSPRQTTTATDGTQVMSTFRYLIYLPKDYGNRGNPARCCSSSMRCGRAGRQHGFSQATWGRPRLSGKGRTSPSWSFPRNVPRTSSGNPLW